MNLRFLISLIFITPLSGQIFALDGDDFAPEKACWSIQNKWNEIAVEDQVYLRPALVRVARTLTFESPIYQSSLKYLISRIQTIPDMTGHREDYKTWCQQISEASDFLFRGLRTKNEFKKVVGEPKTNRLKWTPETILVSDFLKGTPFTADEIMPILEPLGAIEVLYMQKLLGLRYESTLEGLDASSKFIQKRWIHVPFREIQKTLNLLVKKYDLSQEFVTKMMPYLTEFMAHCPTLDSKNIYDAFHSLFYFPAPQRVGNLFSSSKSDCPHDICWKSFRRIGPNYDLLRKKKSLAAQGKLLRNLAKKADAKLLAGFEPSEHTANQ